MPSSLLCPGERSHLARQRPSSPPSFFALSPANASGDVAAFATFFSLLHPSGRRRQKATVKLDCRGPEKEGKKREERRTVAAASDPSPQLGAICHKRGEEGISAFLPNRRVGLQLGTFGPTRKKCHYEHFELLLHVRCSSWRSGSHGSIPMCSLAEGAM